MVLDFGATGAGSLAIQEVVRQSMYLRALTRRISIENVLWGAPRIRVRQLRDAKIKPLVETFNGDVLDIYAMACGWVLARAHAASHATSV
jgi:hypothetical protein